MIRPILIGIGLFLVPLALHEAIVVLPPESPLNSTYVPTNFEGGKFAPGATR